MIKSLLSIASAALAVIFSMPSQAEQIILNQNSSGITFENNTGNTLEVTTTGFGGSANFYANSPAMLDPLHDSSGTGSFGPVKFFTGTVNTGPPAPPNFFIPVPGSPSELFKYQSTSGPADSPGTSDFLQANITWTEVVSNTSISTSEPQLISIGAGVILSGVTGDSTFMNDFPVGGDIDITLSFFSTNPQGFPCTLTDLAAGTCSVTSESASFEGGIATPGGGGGTGRVGTPVVPEPMSTFMALSIALGCLWGTYQVTQRGSRHHSASV